MRICSLSAKFLMTAALMHLNRSFDGGLFTTSNICCNKRESNAATTVLKRFLSLVIPFTWNQCSSWMNHNSIFLRFICGIGNRTRTRTRTRRFGWLAPCHWFRCGYRLLSASFNFSKNNKKSVFRKMRWRSWSIRRIFRFFSFDDCDECRWSSVKFLVRWWARANFHNSSKFDCVTVIVTTNVRAFEN